MSLFRRKKSGKVFPVKISTMDAELEFSLDYKVTFLIITGDILIKAPLPNYIVNLSSHGSFRNNNHCLLFQATGQELFDLVCRTTGLRETWYFGLQYQVNIESHTDSPPLTNYYLIRTIRGIQLG